MKENYNNHNQIERILHKLAFKPWYPRVSLANLESQFYGAQLADISTEHSVFITALPRAGTTLLLNLCVDTNEFASHTYRDMPFLLTPLLWNRFSRNFRDSGSLNERVHGDGILINVDSPESFEEIIWKEFWPSRYKEDRIIPWSKVSYPEFEDFFLEQMRKIILLRSNKEEKIRYISKNNLNIARVGYLSNAFPESTIIILFRSPLQQAASLLKQHQNFLQIHKKDSFAQSYMADTGHYDFGENLRPVDFGEWFSKSDSLDPNTLLFWLRYWINSYRYLLMESNERVIFFSFDALCDDPQRGLERLGVILDVKNIDRLTKNVDRIRIPTLHPVDTNNIPSRVLNQAKEVFLELYKTENF